MSPSGLDWLPVSAFADERLHRLLASAVLDWSRRWFAAETLELELVPHDKSGARLSAGNQSWQRYGSPWAFAFTDAPLALGLIAAGAPADPLPLLDGDTELLTGLGEVIVADLDHVLANAINADPGSGSPAACDKPHDAVEFVIRRRTGNALLVIAISRSALVASRKSLIASPQRAFVAEQIAAAVSNERVGFTARLGTASLTLGEARNLAVGDVLVLDTRLDGEVAIECDRGGADVLTATLSKSGGQLRMLAHSI